MDKQSARELLVEAFTTASPCVLVLGQAASRSRGTDDPVLSLFLGHVGRPVPGVATWNDALVEPVTAEHMAWLTERFERNVPGEAVEAIAELRWSAIFTSSIDPMTAKRFETHGRLPEPVLSADHIPTVPRSAHRPPVYFLFGRTSAQQEATRSPRSLTELTRRRAKHVAQLLSRLEETATPMGTVVIDGFAPDHDWLRIDELFGAIPPSQGPRVLWFGAPAPPPHPLVSELLASGSLVIEERSLASVAAEIISLDSLPGLGDDPTGGREVVSLGGEKFIDLPAALKLRVEASAAIVDDAWTDPPIAVDREATRDAFQRFHGDPRGARSLVDGILRGFSIERPFESKLLERVDAQLARRDGGQGVVVVHGQSGTGKTIACARLVIACRLRRRLPVLFASGRLPPPTDVDAFCLLAEQSGALAVLLICDANTSPNAYLKLSDALHSRGRRVVIVGTSYRLDADRRLPVDLVFAPTDASPAERDRLVGLVRAHSEASESAAGMLREEDAGNVFALLYRVLAYGRERLVAGVSGEVRVAEEFLRTRSQRRPARAASQLAKALIGAGLHDGNEALFAGELDAVFGRDAPGRLIDSVMSVGRLGLFVPVSLVMRTLRARWDALGLEEIAVMFRDLDVFRWRSDPEQSEVLVGPRLQLEAELIARRRLGGFDAEMECVLDLIGSVRARGVDGGAEVTFLFELLQRLDRRGPRGDYYSAGYLRIARALTTLRLQHGLDDVGFILQESGFRRSHLFANDDALSASERDGILNEARVAIDQAIQRGDAGLLDVGPRSRQELLVERAALYGYLAVGHGRNGAAPEEVWSDYQAARAAVRSAIATAPGYYPYDVGLWTSADLLNERMSTRLTEEQRAELRADLYALLDQVSIGELGTDQTEKYLGRKDRVGRVIGDQGISEAALDTLSEINPALAIFLRAREVARPALAGDGAVVSDAGQRAADDASALLASAVDVASHDARCVALRLELEWIAATKERLLRGERQPIPAAPMARETLLGTVRQLRAAGGTFDFRLRFLEAVLLWLTGDTRLAEELWRALARETEYEVRGRPNRRLVLADESKQPVRFRGRLVRQRKAGRWVVEIDTLKGTVDLLADDFRGTTLGVGNASPEFAIAFSFLGPIADPLTRYEVRR